MAPIAQLGLERDTELSHDDDVEGRAQSHAHLGGDGDAPAGQSEDDGPASSETGGPDDQGQVATSVHTIAEHRHHLLDTCSLPPSPRHHQIPASRGLCLWRQVPGWTPRVLRPAAKGGEERRWESPNA